MKRRDERGDLEHDNGGGRDVWLCEKEAAKKAASRETGIKSR